MADRKYALALILLLALVFTGLYASNTGNSTGERVNLSFTNSSGAWAVLEIADNDTERAEGLMNVTELGKHEGMLFKFEEEAPRTFWMKNTLIPLDMIFVSSDKRVINIETAYPQPQTPEEELKLYESERPAKYVIELNAGFAENYSISKGDKVSWQRIR